MGALVRYDEAALTAMIQDGAGFEVNNGPDDDPYWQPVVAIMVGCDDETAEDHECDGDCVVTLTLARPVEFPDDTG